MNNALSKNVSSALRNLLIVGEHFGWGFTPHLRAELDGEFESPRVLVARVQDRLEEHDKANQWPYGSVEFAPTHFDCEYLEFSHESAGGRYLTHVEADPCGWKVSVTTQVANSLDVLRWQIANGEVRAFIGSHEKFENRHWDAFLASVPISVRHTTEFKTSALKACRNSAAYYRADQDERAALLMAAMRRRIHHQIRYYADLGVDFDDAFAAVKVNAETGEQNRWEALAAELANGREDATLAGKEADQWETLAVESEKWVYYG